MDNEIEGNEEEQAEDTFPESLHGYSDEVYDIATDLMEVLSKYTDKARADDGRAWPAFASQYTAVTMVRNMMLDIAEKDLKPPPDMAALNAVASMMSGGFTAQLDVVRAETAKREEEEATDG